MIQQFIYVALGGALGATFRYAFTLIPIANNFNWATFFVNIMGSFLIGLLFSLFQNQKINTTHYLLLATGICGGFTTFSTFSVENIQLILQQKYLQLAIYILSTVTLCLSATAIGMWLVQKK